MSAIFLENFLNFVFSRIYQSLEFWLKFWKKYVKIVDNSVIDFTFKDSRKLIIYNKNDRIFENGANILTEKVGTNNLATI